VPAVQAIKLQPDCTQSTFRWPQNGLLGLEESDPQASLRHHHSIDSQAAMARPEASGGRAAKRPRLHDPAGQAAETLDAAGLGCRLAAHARQEDFAEHRHAAARFWTVACRALLGCPLPPPDNGPRLAGRRSGTPGRPAAAAARARAAARAGIWRPRRRRAAAAPVRPRLLHALLLRCAPCSCAASLRPRGPAPPLRGGD